MLYTYAKQYGSSGLGEDHYRIADAAGNRVATCYLEENARTIVERLNAARFPGDRPTVVCLCGSTRFSEAFRRANLEETLAGRIVLTVGCDFKSDDGLGLDEATKARLDELHLRKIDMADEILVLNVAGYVGKSTRREIEYARSHGKRIRWLVEV